MSAESAFKRFAADVQRESKARSFVGNYCIEVETVDSKMQAFRRLFGVRFELISKARFGGAQCVLGMIEAFIENEKAANGHNEKCWLFLT